MHRILISRQKLKREVNTKSLLYTRVSGGYFLCGGLAAQRNFRSFCVSREEIRLFLTL
jgi:hypothetical protein